MAAMAEFFEVRSGNFDIAIEKLATKVVSFPMNQMVMFHSYVNVYLKDPKGISINIPVSSTMNHY